MNYQNIIDKYYGKEESAVCGGRLLDSVLSDFRHGRKSAVCGGRLIDMFYCTPAADGSTNVFAFLSVRNLSKSNAIKLALIAEMQLILCKLNDYIKLIIALNMSRYSLADFLSAIPLSCCTKFVLVSMQFPFSSK